MRTSSGERMIHKSIFVSPQTLLSTLKQFPQLRRSMQIFMHSINLNKMTSYCALSECINNVTNDFSSRNEANMAKALFDKTVPIQKFVSGLPDFNPE